MMARSQRVEKQQLQIDWRMSCWTGSQAVAVLDVGWKKAMHWEMEAKSSVEVR